MDFSKDFEREVAVLERTVLLHVKAFAPPLDELGKQFCVNVIPYTAFQVYLPLWLQKCFGLSKKVALTAALANVYGSMYFVIQDSVMDDPAGRNRHLLPLGHLFFIENLRIYQSLMHSDERFWGYLRKYIEEYCQSVLHEMEQHWEQIQGFSKQDLVLLGRKMSPLKCSTAVLATLANQDDKIELLSQAIEFSEIGRQIADDIEDWKEDLAAKNYTYPIIRAATQISLDGSAVSLPLGERQIADALFSSGLVESLLEESDHYYGQARKLVEQVGSPYWVQYIDHRMRLNHEAKARIVRFKLETVLKRGEDLSYTATR